MSIWLLTNTTYGTWLPGDPRGSVTSVRDRRSGDETTDARIEHDIPGEPWEDSIPSLYQAAKEQMKGPPIFFNLEHAEIVLTQFKETASYRRWTIYAAAVMHNHFHLVVKASDDTDPRKILADFKAYGSRVLNKRFGERPNGTWWTDKGSKRMIKNEQHFKSAMNYVLHKQPNPLILWSSQTGRIT